MSKLVVTSMIVCFGFLNLIAGTGTSFSVTADDNNYITIHIDKVIKEEIKVSLKNHRGINVFAERIQSDKIISRRYDVNKLENGVYTIQLELDKEIKIQKIKKYFNTIEIYEEDRLSLYKPTIKNNNGEVSVNVFCFHGDFKVKVIDSNGDLVFNKKYEANGSFNTIYDLTTLPQGDYDFKIEMDLENYEGSFDRKINIESGVASL